MFVGFFIKSKIPAMRPLWRNINRLSTNKIFFLFGLFLSLAASFVMLKTTTHAQSSCGVISNVSVSTSVIESGKPFDCTVTVDSASLSNSQRSIACGLSFDGGWPLDFCPSTPDTFGGWNGGSAIFHCAVPNTAINAKKVEAVGYDFKSGCGPAPSSKPNSQGPR